MPSPKRSRSPDEEIHPPKRFLSIAKWLSELHNDETKDNALKELQEAVKTVSGCIALIMAGGTAVLMDLLQTPSASTSSTSEAMPLNQLVNIFIKILKEKSDSRKHQEQIASVIANLTTSLASHTAIINAGGITALVDTMKSFSINSNIQYQLIYSIGNIARKKEGAIAIIDTRGAIFCLVNSLRASRIDTQIQAAFTLANFVFHPVTRTKTVSALLTTSRPSAPGGSNFSLDKLIIALLSIAHSKNTSLQNYVLQVIHGLARNPASHATMIACGVATHLITILNTSVDGSEIQIQTTAAIANLVRNPANHAAFIKSEGTQSLTNLLTRPHTTSYILAKQVLVTLLSHLDARKKIMSAALSASHSSKNYAAFLPGLIKVLLDILMTTNIHASVQLNAGTALNELALSSAGCVALLTATTTQKIRSLLGTSPDAALPLLQLITRLDTFPCRRSSGSGLFHTVKSTLTLPPGVVEIAKPPGDFTPATPSSSTKSFLSKGQATG